MSARLWVVLATLLLCAPLRAEFDYALQARQIAPGVHLVEGGTGHFSDVNGGNIVNSAFIVSQAGVLVIDTGPSRLYGEQLRALIARTTEQPVVRVLNSHHHPDHFFGNQAFADLPIGALAGARAAMQAEAGGYADNLYRLVGPAMIEDAYTVGVPSVSIGSRPPSTRTRTSRLLPNTKASVINSISTAWYPS